MPFGLPSNPKHCEVKLVGRTHDYQARSKLLPRIKIKLASLLWLCWSLFRNNKPQTPHCHFGLFVELVGDQTGRGHFDEDKSNLAVFLTIARGVKVRELGLGIQVIKAELFPGDLGIEPHGRADISSLDTLRYRSTRSYRISSLPSYWLPIIRAKSPKFTVELQADVINSVRGVGSSPCCSCGLDHTVEGQLKRHPLELQHQRARPEYEGVPILFEAEQQPFARDTDAFHNPKLTNVEVTIEGVPNQLYSQFLRPNQTWDKVMNTPPAVSVTPLSQRRRKTWPWQTSALEASLLINMPSGLTSGPPLMTSSTAAGAE